MHAKRDLGPDFSTPARNGKSYLGMGKGMPSLRILFLGIALNYPWELLQAGFYRGMDPGRTPWWHCLLATVGDASLLVAIYAVGALVLQRRDWFAHPGTGAYALLFVLGFIVAVGVEWVALATGRWEYAPSMPILPGLEVGVVPVLQMLFLPPLVFRFALSPK